MQPTTLQKELFSLALTPLLILLLTLATGANAAQRYITDELSAPLRAGGGTEYKILAFLKSGAPLSLIEDVANEQAAKWSRVRTENGTTGWIQTKYLSSIPSAQTRLEKAKIQISANQETLSTQQQSNKQLLAELSQLQTTSTSLKKQLEKIKIEYERLQQISGTAVDLDRTNRELHEKLSLMKVDLEELTIENSRLKESQYVDGITHGAIAVLLGCLMALLIPRMGVKKRTNGWD